MGLSLARARTIADAQFGGGTPAIWYIGGSITVPSDDGTNFVEPVGFNYGRIAVANNLTNWPVAQTVAGVTVKQNGIKLTHANPSGNWGGIRAWGAFVASSGGVPEFFNLLDDVITVTGSNTPVEYDIGQLQTTWGA